MWEKIKTGQRGNDSPGLSPWIWKLKRMQNFWIPSFIYSRSIYWLPTRWLCRSRCWEDKKSKQDWVAALGALRDQQGRQTICKQDTYCQVSVPENMLLRDLLKWPESRYFRQVQGVQQVKREHFELKFQWNGVSPAKTRCPPGWEDRLHKCSEKRRSRTFDK